MRSVVKWAIEHSPAMNTVMITILLLGVMSAWTLRREEYPQFDLEIILVTVPYPGASPEEVESGICQKIEESIRAIDGLKKVTSVASEGGGFVIIEVKTSVPNVQKVLNEIQSEIDRISTFPDLSEEPEVQQLTLRNPAITIGIIAADSEGEDAELQLRTITERVRDDLLQIPQVSVADIVGEREYQIDVQISEQTLREYGLSLTEVAQRIRMRNLELPGGTIRDESETFLLRAKDKRLRGEDIAKIPLVTRPGGVVLRVEDLGTVQDEFLDKTSISRINGKRGLAISVKAAKGEDLLALTQAVRNYVDSNTLPHGYKVTTWGDISVDVKDRLEMLTRNGLQGLILVFIILAMFLEFRLAFWVAMGIPISILGACVVLFELGQTINMLSMFAFLIALGIVVDDAIVVGENIYSHRQMGKNFSQAAIDGTYEVIPSVSTSVTTTVFAFTTMFFVSGIMGKFFAVLPVAVIAMLVISLFECVFILPCHLAHSKDKSFYLTDKINKVTNGLLNAFIDRFYTPVVRFCVACPLITICSAITIVVMSLALVKNGTVQQNFFPNMDVPEVIAQVAFPDGTPSRVADEATIKLENAIEEINAKYSTEESPLVLITHRVVGSSPQMGGAGDVSGGPGDGSHIGYVHAQLVDSAKRSVTSTQIAKEWRKVVSEIPGIESLTFGSLERGPGGTAIEFKLLAPPEKMAELEAAVELAKLELSKYPGTQDISDDSRPGKWEIQLTEKETGTPLGVPLDVIARTVRAAYYGEEVMRLQRGRHEVKLMVRYPKDERRSLASLDDIRVDPGDGVQRSLTEIANVEVNRGYSEINRINQKRSITVSSDVDTTLGNTKEIVLQLQKEFIPKLMKKYPDLRIRWEGKQEQDTESFGSLGIGLAFAMFATFVLLTMEFNSYGQPLIVMSIIPFGIVGAIWGHFFMGLPLTLFSVLGLVALTGVVVNDSIVLVDFINAQTRNGIPIKEAAIQAGQRRFRPVLLTSLTTVAGLLPILLETSFQAQLVIPMATSLCFGLMFSTFFVLLLVPTFYTVYGNLFGIKNHSDIKITESLENEEGSVLQSVR